MEASPAKVIQYFNGEKQNLIPLFQRPYSWKKANWETLWNDIIVQYDANGTQTHFMGAIVSIPARSVPVGVNKHLIIDGQQRLTTVSILLCALRDSLDNNNADRIQEVYLINKFREPEDTLKFVPTQIDRDVYRAIVIDRDVSNSNSTIIEGYKYFKHQLEKGLDGDGQPIDRARLLVTVENSLQVVMINIGDLDDPYLIFESLNFKGQPLTQADLVRNYILMRFKHSISSGGEQEKINTKYWTPLQEGLGERITDFLRHYAMKEGENINQGGIYVAIKQRFSGIKEADEVENKIKEMKLFGDYYLNILRPSNNRNKIIAQYLSNIQALDVTTAYPLIMRLLDANRLEQVNEPDLCECLTLIESFIVRRAICGIPTNGLNKLFLQWCKSFPSENHRQWLQFQMSSSGASRKFPTDDEFGRAFTEFSQYGRGTTRQVLIRLEQDFSHKEVVDLSNSTIEHVLPQTLSEEWKIALGQNADSIHSRLVDTMGNLSLTAYNAELGNLNFSIKKEKLERTHIELNQWILKQNSWGESEIIERSKLLLKRAINIWPGPTLS